MADRSMPARTEHPVGHLAGLDISVMPSALWSMAAIWLGAGLIIFWLLGRGWGWALLGGLLVVIIHWLSDFAHQGGHALAARRTGFKGTGSPKVQGDPVQEHRCR